jgi:hypothetical protein
MTDTNNIVLDQERNVVYFPHMEAAVQFSAAGSKPGSMPTVSPVNSTGSPGKLAYWGTNNKHPQDVITDLEKSPWIGTVLDYKARALYGNGLMYGKVTDFDKDGNEIFQRIKDPAIEQFLKQSNFGRSYLFPACRDLYTFYNVFPELILNPERSLIVDINIKDASFCRWEKQDANGTVKNCFINANWDTNGNESNSKIVPVMDPFWDPAESLRKRKDGYKYIYPVSYPTSGKSYYQLAHWNSIRTSGLLAWATSVIKYKQKMMNNQITVKYLIETLEEYWLFKYPTFASMKPEEKQATILAERQNFDKYLMGDENAGKSIMTRSLVDPITKQQIPGLKITPIQDFIKDNKYIEDSQEASSHLLYALGVDGTLIGNAPGKGMGAGSGSDKRVAFNNYISLCDIHRDLILEPLYMIRDYNKWDPDIQFRFRYPVIMTLDSGKQVQQQTS